jgi:saccharopine dehydrogenase (NADP+, L-glutamate forming)
MLGAGFVTRPTLDVLSDSGVSVTVGLFPIAGRSFTINSLTLSAACRTLESAKSLSAGVKNATPISLDVTDDQALDAELAKHDLVISLIPYTFHATVIKSAIRQKKHVVTTSYVSPAMLELDQQCKDAGITVMNEIGLGEFLFSRLVSCLHHELTGFPADPGIDHLCKNLRRYETRVPMLIVLDAVKTIDEVHREGGKITSFLSYCGGLPAPENSGNPLGYKFSW